MSPHTRVDCPPIFVGSGHDEIYGEEGDDILYVLNDGDLDNLYCQGGNDTVVFVGSRDPNDVIHTVATGGCETVRVDVTPARELALLTREPSALLRDRAWSPSRAR